MKLKKKKRNKKISNSLKGRNLSNEHKEKLQGLFKGKNHPQAKSVICLTTKRIFFTTKEASEYYGISSYTHISSCCKGERNSCGKYKGKKLIWKYLIWKHNKKYRIK